MKTKRIDSVERKTLYQVRHGMKKRCYDESHKSYKYYGGKGITICNEWLNDFEEFYKWCINNGYKKGLTIDRIDASKNYEPENCKFSTACDNYSKKTLDLKSYYMKSKGITYVKKTGKWKARINVNGVQINLGSYSSEEEAISNRIKYIASNF